MTKRHFINFAARIARLNIAKPAAGFDEGYVAGLSAAADAFADLAAEDNSRFDRDKFLTACGF